MKKIISLLFIVVILAGCTEQDYFEIPKDANGNAILTGISSTSTTGISTLDNDFTVTATFATAKPGDVMNVELLQLQIPPSGGTTKQLLPMAGTQKQVTVGTDLKATVAYTRAEAKLNAATEYVTVVFNGATDYAKVRVDMVPATIISKPKVSTKEIEVARTSETAYFNVTVDPKATTDYTGTLIVQRKNGKNGAWVDVPGTPFSGTQPFLVPISGADFAVGQDTMYYQFTASAAGYTDVITTTTVVIDPYFFFKKSGSLATGGASAGRNLLINTAVAENDPNAMLAISPGSLLLKGGSEWLAGGNTIEFVPSTNAMYTANDANGTIAAFEAGTPTTTADPIEGDGVFIFKVVNGPDPEDVYYGMIKVTSVIPGTSLTYENRIGDKYAHLLVIK
ncbi:MAG: membrane lipoprotein lipid attachment site-containing protein [Cyclobacteriaceae bacterium]